MTSSWTANPLLASPQDHHLAAPRSDTVVQWGRWIFALGPRWVRAQAVAHGHQRSLRVRRSGLGWSVRRDDDARGRHLAIEEPQRPERTVIAEQALAAARHHRVDHHPELVNQVVGDQRLH